LYVSDIVFPCLELFKYVVDGWIYLVYVYFSVFVLLGYILVCFGYV
jgi:hypothetical protein